MVTTYDETPTFQDRLAGTTLAVLGRVEDVIETVVDRSGDEQQVQTIVRVEADEILLGEAEDDDLRVRVVGGETDQARTDWTVPVEVGQSLFLLLARDHTPDQERLQYVPYFQSGYPVDEQGLVTLDDETAAELEELDVPVRDQRIQLDDLAEVIDRFQEERLERRRQPPERESAEAERATIREVTEMPEMKDVGAESASPEGERDQ